MQAVRMNDAQRSREMGSKRAHMVGLKKSKLPLNQSISLVTHATHTVLKERAGGGEHNMAKTTTTTTTKNPATYRDLRKKGRLMR